MEFVFTTTPSLFNQTAGAAALNGHRAALANLFAQLLAPFFAAGAVEPWHASTVADACILCLIAFISLLLLSKLVHILLNIAQTAALVALLGIALAFGWRICLLLADAIMTNDNVVANARRWW